MEAHNSSEFSIREVDLTRLVILDGRLRRAMLHFRVVAAALITIPFLNMVYVAYYDWFLVPEGVGAAAFFFGLILFPSSWPLGKKLRFAHRWAAILVTVFVVLFLFLIVALLGEGQPLAYLLVAGLLVLAFPVVIGIVATFQVSRLKPIGSGVDAVQCLRYQTQAPPLSWSLSKLSWSVLYYGLPVFVFVLIAVLASAINFYPIPAILIAIVATVGIGIWSWDRAKQLRQMTAEEARRHDKRPPALLLRSFKDDILKLKPPMLSGKIIKETSFEEIIADQLWARGPVIAIGRPGEHIPPVGAARSYYTDAEWQTQAEKMALESKVIAMIVGITKGLGWEVRRVASLNILRKLLLIFPPIPADESTERWTAFLSHVDDLHLLKALEKISAGKLMMISFLDDEQLVVFSAGERRDPLAYHLALAASTQLLPEKVLRPTHSAEQTSV